MNAGVQAAARLNEISDAIADFRGPKFFVALVLCLTRYLDVRFAFLAEKRESPHLGYTLAFADRDNLLQPFSYDLTDLPCRTVLEGTAVNVPCNVIELFPGARDIAAYCGYPLKDTEGQVIGLLAIEDTKPLAHCDAIAFALRNLAARASAELECERLKRHRA